MLRSLVPLTLAALAAGLAWSVDWSGSASAAATDASGEKPRAAVAVEVASPRTGPLRLVRTYSGTIEAEAEFVVSAEVGGRVEEVALELGQRVERGQVLARIDDATFEQAVAEADADLAVARAEVSEAEGALALAERRLQRAKSLRSGGITTEAALDNAEADVIASRARLAVNRARIARAEASLEAARIRLGQTQVRADWNGGDEARVVAARMVDEGDVVANDAPLFSVVELDTLLAVVFVPERDFARVRIGQSVGVRVDAWPGELFSGQVARIAPVFAASTRQVRVELEVANPDQRLRPGMFTRAEIELDAVQESLAVPLEAVVEREGESGVFVLSDDRTIVTWQSIGTGIVDAGWVQVTGADRLGPVVVLGQELCEDGAPVVVFGANGVEAEPVPSAGA